MSARVLCENFFDPTMFPSHALSAEEEASGKEVERVGSARRQARDHWTSTTAASETYAQVTCDRPRYADTLVLDRGHNLTGETIRLRVSNQSAFTTYTEVVAVVVPSAVYYGSKLTNGYAIRTEEGAILVPFAGHVGKYWRLYIDAMSAGTPKVVGLWVGKSWTPDIDPARPWDDEARQLAFDSVTSPSLWSAAERKAQRKAVTLRVHLSGEQEYSDVRYHIHSLYLRGYAMWYVADTDKGERTWLAMSPPGTFGAAYDTEWRDRILNIALVEHEPEPR